MARRESSAWNGIHAVCHAQKIDEVQLFERSKLLLLSYRRICWGYHREYEEAYSSKSHNGDQLIKALDYLQCLEPAKEKYRFEAQIRLLFDTKWVTALVEQAMLEVKKYPIFGEHYFEILAKSYIDRFKYSESELLEALQIERSCYYDRKKEAIMVFGIALWGNELKRFQHILLDTMEPEYVIPQWA